MTNDKTTHILFNNNDLSNISLGMWIRSIIFLTICFFMLKIGSLFSL